MSITRTIAIVGVSFAIGTGGLIALAEQAKAESPAVIRLAEFQVDVDVSPPTRLDLTLAPGRVAGETPRFRCDHMGGRYTRVLDHEPDTAVCVNVDY